MPGPVAVLPLCPVACGSLLFRVGEELRAAIVVKATFALSHERAAWPIEPLATVERDLFQHGQFSAIGDLVPLLPGASVVIIGGVRGRRGETSSARVALFRDQHAVLSKVGRAASMGPVASSERLVFGSATAAVAAFPSNFDWACLHVAPADQRLTTPLRGDEWLVLDGFRAELPRIQTQLPFTRAEAKYARTDRPGVLTDLPLSADFLLVEPDRMLASVVWRGHVKLGSRDDCALLRVFAGLALPSLPVSWPQAPDSSLRPMRAAPESVPMPDDDNATWPEIADVSSEMDVRAIRAALEAEARDATVSLRSATSPAPRTADVIGPPQPAGKAPSRAEVDDRTAEIEARPFAASLPFEARDATASSLSTASRSPDRAPDRSGLTAEIDARVMPGALLPFHDQRVGEPSSAGAQGVEPAAPPDVAQEAHGRDAGPAGAAARARTVADDLVELRQRGQSARGMRLVGADLAGLDLQQLDLIGADLSGAVLRETNLGGARLQGAKLVGADLHAARLDGADLTGTDLTRATLTEAVLDGAILTRSNLAHANGTGASLRRAQGAQASFARGLWQGADFSGAELDQPDFSSATLSDASFTQARMPAGRFGGARAERASFDHAYLAAGALAAGEFVDCSFAFIEAVESNWEGAQVMRSSFEGATLSKARFPRASASEARFTAADLRGANLQRIDAPAADFSRANLRSVDARQARLAGAVLDDAQAVDAEMPLADLTAAHAHRVDLTSANLREAKLVAADLSAARLGGADLRHANLTDAIVVGSSLSDAKLTGARLDGIRREPPRGTGAE
jgi:uncharacterized protein YjbI with pentapeptide repeats